MTRLVEPSSGDVVTSLILLNYASYMDRHILLIIVCLIVGGGVETGSTRHVGHFWPIVPAPGDCEDG
jgi:hypothetical protein